MGGAGSFGPGVGTHPKQQNPSRIQAQWVAIWSAEFGAPFELPKRKGNLGILVILRPAKLKLGPETGRNGPRVGIRNSRTYQQDAGPIGGHFAEPVWAP